MKKIICSFLCAVLIAQSGLTSALAAGFDNFDYEQEYGDNKFTDISTADWYADSVKAAYRLGLIKGTSDTMFSPNSNITIAQAITMAARIHSIYNTGADTFEQATPWYRVYVDYALNNGIIKAEYPDYGMPATRAQFAEILAGALPDSALMQINSIDDSSIPDVPMTAGYAPAVYKLYRAGILTGNDAYGTFTPDSNIARSGAAAILSRMADVTLRKNITLQSRADANALSALNASEVYDKCSPAVFLIKVQDANQNTVGSGSGFFIDSAGVAVTNYHVVEKASYASALLADGTEHKVVGVLAYDADKDIAVIKVDGAGFNYLETGNSDDVKSGQKIYTVGSPQGLINSISEGIVSQRRDGLIQITAPISSGSSGGALIDEYGRAIGITTFTLVYGQNLNFAVPINDVNGLNRGELISLDTLASEQAKSQSETKSEFLDDVYYETEPNDMPSQALQVLNGYTVAGVTDNYDLDAYYVTCNTTGKIEITLFSSLSCDNLLLVLQNANDEDDYEVASVYTYKGEEFCLLEYTVTKPGAYYICILGDSDYNTKNEKIEYVFYYDYTPDVK